MLLLSIHVSSKHNIHDEYQIVMKLSSWDDIDDEWILLMSYLYCKK